MKEWPVRFYVDADLLGLAHVLVSLRTDVTYPGFKGDWRGKRMMPPCAVTAPDVKDEIWLPIVAERGWVIISRDHNIRENVAERRAVRDSGCRMLALSGEAAANKWDQARLVLQRWDHAEAALERDGPFIELLTRTRIVPLDLDD